MLYYCYYIIIVIIEDMFLIIKNFQMKMYHDNIKLSFKYIDKFYIITFLIFYKSSKLRRQ